MTAYLTGIITAAVGIIVIIIVRVIHVSHSASIQTVSHTFASGLMGGVGPSGRPALRSINKENDVRVQKMQNGS